MPLTPTLPLRIDVDSRLSDDVLLVEPVSVDPGVPNQTAVTLDTDGKPLVLVIAPGAGAAEVADSAGSASGFSLRALPEGGDAKEIVALVDSDNRISAFYATGSAVLHTVRGKDGTWSKPSTLPASTGLCVTEVPLTGEFAVSGITADGNLTIHTQVDDTWAPAKVDVGGRLLGGDARLHYTAPDAWLLFGSAGGKLAIWPGTGTTVAAQPRTVTVRNPVARLIHTYRRENSVLVLFTDIKHNLYSSVRFTDSPAPIPLGQVVQGSAVVDENGLVHCYGCAPDGRLWQLRQTGWTSDDSPIWADMFPLDTDTIEVRTPVAGFGTLVVTRADGGIDLLSRRDTASRWIRVPVQSEARATPQRVARYRTRLTVTDATGMRCGCKRVRLTPTRLLALEVGGRTVIAGPDRPATLTTDETGCVEFSQHATDLDPATFTALVEGAPAPLTVTPHGYLKAALAGTAPVFTGTATIPPMSDRTLLAAQVNGRPLAPGLNGDLACVAANAIKEATKIGMGTGALSGFEVDLRDPVNPRFVAYETGEALSARMAEFHGGPDAGPPADGLLARGIGDWFHDLWNAIKSGAVRIYHAVVDTANRVISCVVQVAEGITTELKNLALTGAAEVASFVHGLFNMIGAAAQAVLDWLKDALHWDSIWRTMEAFYGYLTGGMKSATEWLEGPAVVATRRFLADLKSDIGTRLDAVATILGDRRIGDIPGVGNLPWGRAPGATKGWAPGPPPLPGSSAQHNWVLSKALAYLPDQPYPVTPRVRDGFADQLNKAIAESGIMADGGRALRDLTVVFGPWLHDPSTFRDARVADLLTALRDLIDLAVDGADILVTLLLDLAGDAVQGILDLLSTPLADIPVLTWLWDNVVRPRGSADELTLGRLLCLALATPVTLACLLEKGHGPYDRVAAAESAQSQGFDPLAAARYYTSCVLVDIDMVADTINAIEEMEDGGPPGGSKIGLAWNWLDVVANGIVQVLFWPVEPILSTAWDWSAMSKGEQTTNGTWIGYWAPIATDGFFNLLNTIEAIRKKELPAPSIGFFGANAVLDFAMGLVLVGAGLTGAVLEFQEGGPDTRSDTAWVSVVEAALGPLPWVGQPLLLEESIDATEGASIAIQLVLDIVGDFDAEDAS